MTTDKKVAVAETTALPINMSEVEEAFDRIYKFANKHLRRELPDGVNMSDDVDLVLRAFDRVEALEHKIAGLDSAYKSAVEYNDALKESHYENVKETADELLTLRTREVEAKRIFDGLVDSGAVLSLGFGTKIKGWIKDGNDN